MRLPGVEVKPIRQITGEPEFNEIFLDEVRIPEEMRVGQEGEGWRIAISTSCLKGPWATRSWPALTCETSGP